MEILQKLQVLDERFQNIEALLSLKKNVLNIEEVCRLTGLSQSTIYKFTSSGSIPHFKQAKHLYFNRIEIEEWLQSIRGFNASEIRQEAMTYLALSKN